MKNTKTILGFLAIGVAIGIMLSPEKGNKLRSMIMGSIDDLGEQLGNLISDAKDKFLGAEEEASSDEAEIPEEFRTNV